MYRLLLLILLISSALPAIDEIDEQGQYIPVYFAELLDAEIYNPNTAYLLGVGGFIFIDISNTSNPRFM